MINRIREGLLGKKETLEQWQVATPESEKQMELGYADESALETQLEIIDEALEKIRHL
jgi:hypothetical protein